MKILVNAITVLICACVMAGTTAASPKRQARAEDEAAIRKIVTRMQEGWNTGSGKEFAAVFDEDADYVIVNGMRVKGRKEIDAGHQHIFDTVYKNSRQSSTVHTVRFLSDTIALAHVEWNLKLADASEGKAMSLLVLTKKNGQWSISAFHNTRIASSQK
ncbi:MAG TPA: SgcJ/EcaC family oxidoreductase [Blastocatellia bacterium]|nr:SgcJ/EcaC family oxidoreductase [Blastocatellia bacterium]